MPGTSNWSISRAIGLSSSSPGSGGAAATPAAPTATPPATPPPTPAPAASPAAPAAASTAWVVTLSLVQARGLPCGDVYAEASVGGGPAQRTARRSGHAGAAGAPVFNARLTFTSRSLSHSPGAPAPAAQLPTSLRVRLLAHHRLRAAGPLGEVEVPLAAGATPREVRWLPLAGPGAAAGAAVQLQVDVQELEVGSGGSSAAVAAAVRLDTAARVGLTTLRVDALTGLSPGPAAARALGGEALRAGGYALRFIFGHGLRRFHARAVPAPAAAGTATMAAAAPLALAQTLRLWLSEGEQDFLLSVALYAEVPAHGGKRLVQLGKGYARLAELADTTVKHRFLVYLRESVAKGEGLTDADERVMTVAAEAPASSPAASPTDSDHDGSGVHETSEGAGCDGAFAVDAAAAAAAAAAAVASGEDAPAPATPAATVEHVSGLEAEASGPLVGCLSLRGVYSPRAELERDFFARLLADWDTDKSGSLDPTEIAAMLHSLGTALGGDTDGAAEAAKTLPLRADGRLDSAAFLAWLDSPAFHALPMAYSLLAFLADGKDGHHALVNDITSAVSQSVRRTRAGAAILALDEGDRTILADSGLKIFDRRTGLIVTEHIPSYVHTALNLMYHNAFGSRLVNTTAVRKVLAHLSAAEGRTMSAPASVSQIAPFVATHNINLSECKLERIADYPTFNAFFYRELKPEARPIAAPHDASVVISPADSRVVAYGSVSAATQLWIKGASFTVETLLGPACADVAPLFVGGSVLLSRLAPQDYHRWHLPVTGRLGRRATIDGALYTVSPIAIRRSRPDVFSANKREVLLVHTRDFGLVAMVAVGATVVGSINIVAADGSFQMKGACHGYFAFGGSTVLTLFQPNTVTFDADLLRNSATPLETYVRVGERVGVAARPGGAHAHALSDDDPDWLRAVAAAAVAGP